MTDVSSEIIEILEEAYARYAKPAFIELDPISIPANFSKKEDIEIAGFLAATIAWGQRATIIRNAKQLMDVMDWSPHDFIVNHHPKDRMALAGFVHRTFNEVDAMYFFEALQHIYRNRNGLEEAFGHGDSVQERIAIFHDTFFDLPHMSRTRKHVSNPRKGSSAKRLNMFLRWMVRTPLEGIDFGIWKSIKPSQLVIPLDVHTGTVGRQLGLFSRKQNDWKAVEELTNALRAVDPVDPVRFDLALFGIGVSQSSIR